LDGEDEVGKAAEEYPQTKNECSSATGSDSLVDGVKNGWMSSGICAVLMVDQRVREMSSLTAKG
jgi:hypothetical protein